MNRNGALNSDLQWGMSISFTSNKYGFTSDFCNMIIKTISLYGSNITPPNGFTQSKPNQNIDVTGMVLPEYSIIIIAKN